MAKITKEQFDIAYNKHLPKKWVEWVLKYYKKQKNCIVYFLLIIFGIGFFSTIFNAPRILILISSLTFSIILALFVFVLLFTIVLNNIRINKICKELGISQIEYDNLINEYFS